MRRIKASPVFLFELGVSQRLVSRRGRVGDGETAMKQHVMCQLKAHDRAKSFLCITGGLKRGNSLKGTLGASSVGDFLPKLIKTKQTSATWAYCAFDFIYLKFVPIIFTLPLPHFSHFHLPQISVYFFSVTTLSQQP